MGRWKDKYVIGLTGNIAMGKSLVRRMLEHLGAYPLDADALAHRVMEPNAPAYRPIVEAFGRFILDADGRINRERLGAIVFANPQALATLEQLTHPTIRMAIDTLISRAKQPIIVVEAIKLVEGELAQSMDAIWVVDAKPELQLQRLMSKRGLSEVEAKMRMQAQNPQADKLAKATVVIKNNGTPEETWAQVQAAWVNLRGGVQESVEEQTVGTVQVQPEPAQSQAPSVGEAPRPAQTGAPITSVNFKRPRPKDFDQIAQLINAETGANITRGDIMAKFGEKTYLLAEANGQPLGVIAFMVENLVTQVDEFVISKNAPLQAVGKGLIEAMEKASDELQSEVAFVFLPKGAEVPRSIFSSVGYEETIAKEIRYPAWREAVTARAAQDQILLSKRLRENLVLKPI